MSEPTPSRATAITLLCVACLTIMVGCVIVPGLPIIAPALGMEAAAGWLVTVPSLGVVVFGPLAAYIIHRYDMYTSLLAGLAAYGVFGVCGAFLADSWLIFVDRLLLGGATALVMASGTGLISVFYEGKARMNMMARQGMAIELGGVIMLSLGGILAGISWYWPFALYLSAWLLFVMVLIFVPHPQTHNHGSADSDSIRIPAAIRLLYFSALMAMVAFFSAIILLPFKLHALGFSEAQTGYLLSFVSLIAVVAAGFMPKAVRGLGEYRTLVTAFVLYTCAHLAFAAAESLAALVAAAILLGAGFGLSIPLVNFMTVEQSHPQQRGRLLAFLSMAVFSGQFLSSFMDVFPQPLGLLAASALSCISAVVIVITHKRIRARHAVS